MGRNQDPYFRALHLRISSALSADDLWVGTVEHSFARVDTEVVEVKDGVFVLHAEEEDDLFSYRITIEPLT